MEKKQSSLIRKLLLLVLCCSSLWMLTSCSSENQSRSNDTAGNHLKQGQDKTPVHKKSEKTRLSIDNFNFNSIEYEHLSELFPNQDSKFTKIGENPNGFRAKVRMVGSLPSGEKITEFKLYEPKQSLPYLSGYRIDGCESYPTKVRFLKVYDIDQNPLVFSDGYFYPLDKAPTEEGTVPTNSYRWPIWKQPANDMLQRYLCPNSLINVRSITPGMKIEEAIRIVSRRWSNPKSKTLGVMNLTVDGKDYQAICGNGSALCWFRFERRNMPFAIEVRTDGFVVIQADISFNEPFNKCKNIQGIPTEPYREQELYRCSINELNTKYKDYNLSQDNLSAVMNQIYGNNSRRHLSGSYRLDQYQFKNAFVYFSGYEFYGIVISVHPNHLVNKSEADKIFSLIRNALINARPAFADSLPASLANYKKEFKDKTIIYSIEKDIPPLFYGFFYDLTNDKVDSVTFMFFGD